jgi:hypothetical protein
MFDNSLSVALIKQAIVKNKMAFKDWQTIV